MKAFLKKEWMEWSRTGRLAVLLLVFTVFGIMNPAIAKLTPWLMETVSESLAETGIVTTAVTVDAMTSWVQFYKNIPMGLIIFVLVCSGVFTAEYEKGTLVLVVTKGLARRKVLIAKAVFLFGAWTILYFLCVGITYGYNEYFWDNGIAADLPFAVACTWLFGIWVTALLILFSSMGQSGSQVLLGTGGVAMGVYLLGMFPKLARFLPGRLLEGMALLQRANGREDYYIGMAAAAIMVIGCLIAAAVCFDRRQL